MAARSRKYFCSVPSRAPPTWDREISVKLLSTTGESRENRQHVEESSNGEYMASLERSTEVNWCELPTWGFFNSCWIFWSNWSMPQKKEIQAGGATCVSIDRRGTVRGTRLSVAGNSSERKVRATLFLRLYGNWLWNWSVYCPSTELQASSSSEQEYSSRSPYTMWLWVVLLSPERENGKNNYCCRCHFAGRNQQLLLVYGVGTLHLVWSDIRLSPVSSRDRTASQISRTRRRFAFGPIGVSPLTWTAGCARILFGIQLAGLFCPGSSV